MKTSTVKNAVNENINNAGKQADYFINEAEKTIENLTERVEFATEKLKSASSKFATQSVDFVKRYPLHSAVGATLIGLAAGYILGRPSRKDEE